MASTSKGNDSQAIAELRSKKVPSAVMPNKDQRFLLYFIFGTYFGPDLKGEKSHKSVLQRKSEGLPPYSSGDLAGSLMEMVQLERIYYYILRKANKSLSVKSPLLDQFFKGKLPCPPSDEFAAKYPQFPDLFPMELHCHSKSKNQCDIIESIVFIHNPEIGYIKIEHIARFGRLTGLEDFSLDRDAAMLLGSAENDNVDSLIVQDGEPAGDLGHLGSPPRFRKIKRVQDVIEREDQHVRIPPLMKSAATSSADAAMSYKASVLAKNVAYTGKKDDAAMLFFPSPPSREEMGNIVAATRKGAALMGTAAMGKVGPIVGLMDIGECEDAYMFRVSLPGVKRDESEFSCEVGDDGKVLIRGVTTTGEKTVYRFSQTFEMLSQNLCPPGHFSISFQLPGPVDPQQFSGNFGTDGILEGIVMKKKQM